MSKPVLYIFPMPTFNASKPLLAGEEAGVDFDVVLLNAAAGEHRDEAHRERHPLGKIPALKHGEFQLFESLSIARYFDAIAGGPLTTPEPQAAATINQWADFVVNHIGRAVGSLYMEEFLKPTFRQAEPDSDAVAAALKQLARELPLLDQALASQPYLGGEQYSLADVVLLAYLAHEDKLSIDLAPTAHLAAWYEAARQRPASERAFARYG